MAQRLSRREFVKTGTAAGMIAAARPAFGQAPTVLVPSAVKPVVIASSNGNKYKNGGPRTAVEEALGRITRGEDVLDAVIAGVNIVELDPEDDSVGYGGLPNADGVVQLDSCCMHGPKKRAGGVAALEGVRTPSLVAKAVLEQTDHHLIVGKGAQNFARALGFTRARLSQLLDLTLIAPDIQEEVLHLEAVGGYEPMAERHLRPLSGLPWSEQRPRWRCLRDQLAPHRRRPRRPEAAGEAPPLGFHPPTDDGDRVALARGAGSLTTEGCISADDDRRPH